MLVMMPLPVRAPLKRIGACTVNLGSRRSGILPPPREIKKWRDFYAMAGMGDRR
jgi:hypothetical protein